LDLSDLGFYQSVLRARGIRHVLSAQEQTHCVDTSPEPVPVMAGHEQLRFTGHGQTTAKPHLPESAAHALSSVLLEYRRPAYCVWSYFNLPEDIQKGFTNPRGDLITNIINNLQWNKMNYTFWPLSSLKRNHAVPDSDLFFSGLKLIKPVYAFIFGSKAFHVLLGDRKYSYGQHSLDGLQIISLPDFDSLLPDNRLLKYLVWNVLKQFSPPKY